MIKRSLSFVALVVFEIVAIVTLHALGRLAWLRIPWAEVGTWIDVNPVEDTIGAMVRYLALAIAYWMLTTTVLYAIAKATRFPAAVRAVEWATLPAVRRVADRVAATTLSAVAVAGPALPALAQQPPTPVVREVTTTTPNYTPVPAGPGGLRIVHPPAPEPGYTPTPAGTPRESTTATTPGGAVDDIPVVQSGELLGTTYTVKRGDSFWCIATQRVEAETGSDDLATVTEYWVRLVDANRDTISSGDPDLIYPNEVITLPALSDNA